MPPSCVPAAHICSRTPLQASVCSLSQSPSVSVLCDIYRNCASILFPYPTLRQSCHQDLPAKKPPTPARDLQKPEPSANLNITYRQLYYQGCWPRRILRRQSPRCPRGEEIEYAQHLPVLHSTGPTWQVSIRLCSVCTMCPPQLYGPRKVG